MTKKTKVNTESMKKSNRTLSIHIIRNKETLLLHQVLGYLKELWDDYGTESIFLLAVNLKSELLEKFENELALFCSGRFAAVHSSTMNPCQIRERF